MRPIGYQLKSKVTKSTLLFSRRKCQLAFYGRP
uniref:Uncharacterized protein n=1 Tax=Rhizophora mucronata TaxID=61149 RepID=A0A2P2NR55_RHIMU